jgi:hypothetical protein
MEVVAARYWRTSESRQVHSLEKEPGHPPGRAPFPLHTSTLTEPSCVVSGLI